MKTIPDTFSGEVVLPDDPGYDAARIVWNGTVDRYPAMIVRPTSADEVSAAIRFGRENELTIAVRGGGHSIPGFSTCDGGLVIDLSRMGGVRVDPERRVAVANGGALLGELDEQAQAVGLVCPVGVVSHTGVAGLTLGGGMGRLQRKFGLTIDSLRSVELVTADGRLVHASEDENAELFWGLRGAGPNFGVVTSFEFRLHPLAGPVTHGTVIHPIERVGELATLFVDTLDASPDELWLGFGLARALPTESFPSEIAGQPIATVMALHCGSPDDAERDLRELRAFGPPVADSIEPKPYLVTQQLYDESMEWGRRFYMKSAFVPELPKSLVNRCADRVRAMPAGVEGSITIWCWGRAIAQVPEEETAFSGRGAAYWIAAESFWDDPALDADARAWARDTIAEVEPFAASGRYVNDVSDVGDDLARWVYGDAKYDRLVALKRQWDPDNVFRLNQNVRP